MKRSLAFLAVLVFAFGLTGCVQATIETTINADGSGVFSMNAAVSESVAEALKELEELGGMEGMDDTPSMDIDRAELEAACKKHGVTIKKFEEPKPGGAQMVDMVLEFKDLAGLNAVLGSSMDNAGGMKLFKTGDGNYILRGGEAMGYSDDEDEEDADEEADSDTAEEMDPAKMGKAMEIMGKLMASMQELEMNMRITVPGDIIESSAPETDGRTSIWTINAENMMQAEAMGDPEIVFSGKGLDLEAEPEE